MAKMRIELDTELVDKLKDALGKAEPVEEKPVEEKPTEEKPAS